MNFPDSYFEDEVRDGFYVSSLMKRAWAAQLEVLEDIDKVCKKHNIRYFAEWGTLLGTVRHGGFIPWDDDLDICMFREDYEKFSKVAPKELPAVYQVLNYEHMESDETNDYLTRVHSGRVIRTDQEYLNKFHGFPFVAGIDLFPLDYLPRNEHDVEMYKKQLVLLSTNAMLYDQFDDQDREARIAQMERLYQMKFDRTKSIKKQIFMLADHMCGMFKEKDADYVTLAALFTKQDYRIPKECYEDVIYMPYETMEIPVPIGYDTILRIKYGDYMRSVRAKGGHDYPFYKKQVEGIEWSDIGLFQSYHFSQNDLERSATRDNTSLKEISVNIVNLLEEAHEKISSSADSEDWNSVIVLLEDCQDGAIAFGEKVEQVKGMGTQLVLSLEKYCEDLYFMHEAILDAGSIEISSMEETLKQDFVQIKKHNRQEIVERREVVFVPYQASYWNSMDSVWEAACQDEKCDVYVVPVPFFRKNVDGSLSGMYYDGGEYPENVPICAYNTFDFGLHRPDQIFIQNPYDGYNASICVHPFFYAQNLKEYTDCLVYIPYFVMDEIADTDERGKMSLEYCCTVPGVVHSDVVVVQSEQMKKMYVEALTDWAGEDTKSVWEKKILPLGSPLDDAKKKDKAQVKYPSDWNDIIFDKFQKRKRIVCYGITLGALLETGERALDKIESVLQVFKEKKGDIALVWKMPGDILYNLKKVNKKQAKKLRAMIEQYKNEGWGILCDSIDDETIVLLSDAYYGDSDKIVQLFKKYSLPVMIQNFNVL